MILHGDCMDRLRELADNSVDAIVTDPPYGLAFMGKKWDYDVPSVSIWKECLRVLKPGGHLLSFAGTRTQHRMAINIEDAGFEIRDMIMWVYGSGFPKSLNIGKAVDKLRGDERADLGEYDPRSSIDGAKRQDRAIGGQQVAPSKTSKLRLTKGTSEWEGWGSALKPAVEPITLARKPLDGTIAENCLKWGVGGINVDASRVETNPDVDDMLRAVVRKKRETDTWEKGSGFKNEANSLTGVPSQGRFPSNLILSKDQEVLGMFPETKSGGADGDRRGHGPSHGDVCYGEYKGLKTEGGLPPNSGSAARFFKQIEGDRIIYQAKASKAERNAGCEGLEHGCNHPTIKPLALMQYLIKLITPEGGTVLDPFAGSGTTGLAAKRLGYDYILIEREQEYIEIITARLKDKELTLF